MRVTGRHLKIAVVCLAVFLGLVLVVQNTQVVSVRFLAWELAMSQIILIVGTMAVGFVAGFVLAKLGRRV